MVKICFAGLGSIGKRHLKNVTELLQKEGAEYIIDAVRTGRKKLPADIAGHIHHEYDAVSQIPDDYDIFFVTNPTINHMDTIREAIPHTCHMFIEKPVFDKPCKELKHLSLKNGSVYYVACPLRYSPIFRYVKNIVNKEAVFSARSISSSYLPDWRGKVDYRNIYSADKQKGGGVTLDLIHELDYLTDLFGIPERSLHVQGKYSDLEITSDDISLYILQYKDKLAEIHLDYFGRESIRKLELFCRNYVVKCDFINSEIEYVFSDHKENIILDKEDMYQNEMKAFFCMVDGTLKNTNNLFHANQILELALQW